MTEDAHLAELAAIRRRLTLALIVVVAIALYFSRDVVLPIIIAMLLSLALSPVVRSLERSGIPPAVTAVTLIVVLGAAGLTGVYFLSGVLSEWIEAAPEFGRKLRWRLAGLMESVDAIKDASKEVEDLAGPGKGPDAPQKVVVDQPRLLTTALSGFAGFGTTLVVSLILAMFVLASGDMFYAKLVASFRTFSDKRRALGTVRNIERSISRYLFSITLVNAGLGVMVGAAFYALGLPYSLAWGAAAFLLNYLPFLGMIVGACAAGAYALVTFASVPYALLVPAAYLVINAIESQVATPIVVGRRLEVNTVAILLTLIFWTWLWGVPGALLAMPILVVFKAISDNVAGLQALNVFLSVRDIDARSLAREAGDNSGDQPPD